LLAFGIVVLAGAIALVIKLRPGATGPTARSTPEATPTIRADRAASLAGRGGAERGGAERDTPIVAEGARVRDHRTGDHAPYQGRSRDPDVHATRLPPALVHDISGKLQTVMAECTTTIAPEALGKRPRVIGSIFVDVTGGQLTVKDATVELSEITGDPGPVTRCMQEKWIGQTTSADDATVASHHEISVAFAVAPR
jgi:hypothetical protein